MLTNEFFIDINLFYVNFIVINWVKSIKGEIIMRANKKHLVLLLIDILLINLTMWFSFFLRFEGIIPIIYESKWAYYVVLVTFFRIGCFYYFGLYKSLWSYSSLPELIQIIKAVTVSSVLIAFSDQVFLEAAIPRSVLFISCIFLL